MIQKKFQYKYTGYLVVSSLISAVIMGGPAYYFLNQNYNIFIDLAYVHSPEIIQHLQEEQSWINGFLISSFISLLVFQIYFGFKLTFRMVGPLSALKYHIQRVTRGELYSKPLFVRENDEFHDIVDTYNYLYKTLCAQTIHDIKKLEQLKTVANKNNLVQLVDSMILEKKSQINETSSSSEKDHDLHRAS